jgi:hypothetical protein
MNNVVYTIHRFQRWPILDRTLDSIEGVDNYTVDLPSNPKVVGSVVCQKVMRYGKGENMLDLIQPYSLSTPDGVILLARHDSRYSTEREQWDGVGVSQPLVRTQQTRFLSFARSLHFASLTPFFVQPIVPLHLLTRSTGRWRCILAGETIMIQSIMAWQYQVR